MPLLIIVLKIFRVKSQGVSFCFISDHWKILSQGLTATGIKKDDIFVGDISTQYQTGNTIVDVKVDTYSNVSAQFP